MNRIKAFAQTRSDAENSGFALLAAVSIAHLLNDAMQTAVPASFPLLQEQLRLNFAQIGWIAFALNVTASVLQPAIGFVTDRKSRPWLMPAGMVFTLLGMVLFGLSPRWHLLLPAAVLVGIGSSILHPESSRVAYGSMPERRGLAQSIFQLGGNTGQALAPLAVALFVAPLGQGGLLWFALPAVLGIVLQLFVSGRTRASGASGASGRMKPAAFASANLSVPESPHSHSYRVFLLTIFVTLLFSKFVYLAAMNGYYAFYAIDRFHITPQRAQLYLFVLQAAGMLGTFLGGPLADRFGRKRIIWFSILGTAPFSLLLPFAGPYVSLALLACIGMILMSGFSVIVVFGQELLPGRVGAVSGLFFGVAFGFAGLGSALLGHWIDAAGISPIIRFCALLPLLGAVAFLLPNRAEHTPSQANVLK
jgi:FSR family fosmidomycin resistance protein-like MFS transporter